MDYTFYFKFSSGVIRADHYLHRDSFKHVPAHNHQTCELLFVKQGDITYIVEDKQYRVEPNSLIISRPLETHSILVNNPTTYDRYDIIFDEKLLSSIYSRIPRETNVINFNGNKVVINLFSKMDYYCTHAPNDVLSDLLLHLIGEILYNVLLAEKEQNRSDAYTINPVMAQAIQYINNNITSPLQIDDICDALYITKSHLHHLFIAHLNISPHKYILLKKLRLAQKELQAGASPTEVYSRYGFVNYATFYRNYKRVFGTTPSNASEINPLQRFDDLL